MSDKDNDPYLHGLRGGLAPPTEGGTDAYMKWRMGKDQHDQAAKTWSSGNQPTSGSAASGPHASIVYLVLILGVVAAGWYFWNQPTEEEKRAELMRQQELIFSQAMLDEGFVEPAHSELDTLYGCAIAEASLHKGPGTSFEVVKSLEAGTDMSMIFGPQGDLSSEGSPWIFVTSPYFGYVSGKNVRLESDFSQGGC